MMFEEYYNDICLNVKEKGDKLVLKLSGNINFIDLEKQITALFNECVIQRLKYILQNLPYE